MFLLSLALFVTSLQADGGSLIPEVLVQSKSPHVLIVDKENRKLSVWELRNNSYVKIEEHPSDMGKIDGNKSKLNDHRTPEGVYFFTEHLTQLPFDLYGSQAFATNYPNHFDSIDGKTGYGIWLHAIPDTVPLTRGSRGCVVVRNSVINHLATFVKLNETPLIITDQLKLVPAEVLDSERTQVLAWLESWKQAWESRNIDNYIGFYGQQFLSQGMKLRHWKRFKESLIEKYSFIKVQTTAVTIIKQSNDYEISFYQIYNSDKLSDYGYKTLYVRSIEGKLNILGEDWKAVENRLASDAPLTNAN